MSIILGIRLIERSCFSKFNTNKYNRHLICYLGSFFFSCCIESKDDVKKKEEDSDNKDPIYLNISDILLWAIFANRRELAEICWLRGTDQLRKLFTFLKLTLHYSKICSQ